MFQEGDEHAEIREASKQDERLGPGDMSQPGADRHQRGMAAGEGADHRVRRRISGHALSGTKEPSTRPFTAHK